MTKPWFSITDPVERAAARALDDKVIAARAIKDATATWKVIARHGQFVFFRRNRRRAVAGFSKIRHEYRDEPTRRLAMMLAATNREPIPGLSARAPQHEWQHVILTYREFATPCLSAARHSLECALQELLQQQEQQQ